MYFKAFAGLFSSRLVELVGEKADMEKLWYNVGHATGKMYLKSEIEQDGRKPFFLDSIKFSWPLTRLKKDAVADR